mmetsp:Transcript_738/g.2013  ORF Transcript_738/g.2013 Transcript_738/m.2013 type:complete len:292 (-) Transcript_738:43-918(-)
MPSSPAASGNPASDMLRLIAENWVAFAITFVVAAALQVYMFARKALKTKAWLNPEQYQPLRLAQKRNLNHNTLFLRFELPSPNMRLGLPIGQHISFMAKDDDGKDVYRSYTPVSDDDQLGSVDFVIKVYPQGKMTQVLDKMRVGETLMMRGPKGRLQYVPNMKKHIGMLAGGTGITPMYQVLNAIVKNPSDTTSVSVVFGNITEEDILLRTELDNLVKQYPNRVKVHYVLDKPPAGWTGGSGYITADVMKAHLPPPGPGTLVLRCGPGPMMDAMKKALDSIGYGADAQFQF